MCIQCFHRAVAIGAAGAATAAPILALNRLHWNGAQCSKVRSVWARGCGSRRLLQAAPILKAWLRPCFINYRCLQKRNWAHKAHKRMVQHSSPTVQSMVQSPGFTLTRTLTAFYVLIVRVWKRHSHGATATFTCMQAKALRPVYEYCREMYARYTTHLVGHPYL